MASRRPIPLRRLSTRRFKTLEARENDNARRRVKRSLERESSESWAAAKEAKTENDYRWSDIASYTDRVKDRARRYAKGQRDFSDEPDLEAPEGLPPEAGYYHKA